MESYDPKSLSAHSRGSFNRVLKYHLTSLGCPKNLVESEEMMALLAISGMVLVHDPEEADLLIVNTCGFIAPAKEESVDVILELCHLRRKNPWQRLIVVGCLVQRYRRELQEELPEVDVFIGVEDKNDFLPSAWRVFERPPQNPINQMFPFTPRLLTTPPHLAYLRISDGCFHKCSFCAIPKIRGHLRSRPMEEIVAEAKSLAAGGVKELVIVSQDTTSYGIDLYNRLAITDLLSKLEDIEDLEWIRLMYLFPHLVNQKLIHYFSRSQKLVSYVDLPIQHGDPEILKLMNRGATVVHIRRSIEQLREVRPDMTIRSTVIVGFPGEKQRHFENMMLLLEELDFDRLGVFKYYKEDGTPAELLPNHVSDRIKDKRFQIVFDWSMEKARQRNKRFIGDVLTVLIDGKDAEGDGYWGRYQGQAPEVDGQVYVRGRQLIPGRFAPVRISEADEENLFGYIHSDINLVNT
ncbi:MAG: 30S ribosomal protein S12 methylthiotransferase RimO [Candidatus Hinthialibacter sp.]